MSTLIKECWLTNCLSFSIIVHNIINYSIYLSFTAPLFSLYHCFPLLFLNILLSFISNLKFSYSLFLHFLLSFICNLKSFKMCIPFSK